jgi:hypothetical protein
MKTAARKAAAAHKAPTRKICWVPPSARPRPEDRYAEGSADDADQNHEDAGADVRWRCHRGEQPHATASEADPTIGKIVYRPVFDITLPALPEMECG